ncbi:hypothetical protein [Sphingomonas pruni]|uniref:hypothetical protein n=1 Tax=Sphingomonas pruni TaxID=40683 RepID=UPI0008348B00|nr:hypothetical protein [Sphingomonas pruni]
MTARSPLSAWSGLAFDSWALAWEASAVVGLRLAEIARGDGTLAEASLMTSEKISAAIELQASLVAGGLSLTPLQGAERAVRLYRRKVRANRRRLNAAARK